MDRKPQSMLTTSPNIPSDSQRHGPQGAGDPVSTFSEEIARLRAEIAVLRRVVRATDYLAVAGQDSRYDEARKALTEFDRAAQKGAT
jgi:hypothetical protein